MPCLFVHGTADPFGTPDELQRWTATIAGPVTHHFVDGGRHDLKGKDAEVVDVVARVARRRCLTARLGARPAAGAATSRAAGARRRAGRHGACGTRYSSMATASSDTATTAMIASSMFSRTNFDLAEVVAERRDPDRPQHGADDVVR